MTTLLTITHDPEGKQLPHFSHNVFSIFDHSYMVATQTTSLDLLDAINSRCVVKTRPKNGMCQARRDVVELAWNEDPTADRYFYCDFDRLLFWWETFPEELEQIVNMRSEMLVLGRTETALSTYPALQYETERAMNRIARFRYSFIFDFFAGARLFVPGLSKILMRCQGEEAVLDIEWPLMAFNTGMNIEYLAVNGLAYEAGLLDLGRSAKDEMELRCRNLKSILDYVGER